MNLEQCKQKIDRYLRRKSEGVPLVVDVQNGDDQKALVEHYGSLNNALRLKASDYCAHDEMPRIEDILNDLLTKDATMIVTGVTAFLRLKGKDALRGFIDGLLGMNNIAGHAIFIAFQCGEFLRNGDPRRGRLIAEVEGDAQAAPEIVFAPPGIPLPEGCHAEDGIEKFAEAVESSSGGIVYVLTNKKKSAFQSPMYAIQFIEGAYAAISRKCKGGMPDESLGTDAEWSYALTLFEDKSSWEEVVDATIGHTSALASIISGYKDFPDNKKWLCFVALKMFGAGGDEYLETAARQAKSAQDFATRAYRCLLEKSASDKDFWDYYKSRKQLLASLGNPTAELDSYCSLALAKGIDGICYLTDATQREKEAVFEYLDKYGQDANQDELMERLKTVYPELHSYLSPYHFRNELPSLNLTQYFQDYKWQKATNKVWPQFVRQVEELAKTRDYFGFLDSCDSVVEKLNKEDSRLYFMDAMGVEYLGYIVALCGELNLFADITVCKAELPTITSRNKGFVDLFAGSGHEYVDFKEIDDIKHEGIVDSRLSKNSLPIYIIEELAAIRKALVNIKNDLRGGAIRRAFMIADHGASRLAVLHNTENVWEMSEKGERSGRCCPKSDVDEQPAFAVNADDYWALANYDRFRGGRKATVEAHGGATLEEVCVPVIEIGLKPQENARVELMDADGKGDGGVPVIEVSFNKRPELKIFLSVGSLQDISLEVNGKRYPAEELGDGCYHVEMKGLKKGTYSAKVFAGDNPIGEPLSFVIKSKGMQEKDLL